MGLFILIYANKFLKTTQKISSFYAIIAYFINIFIVFGYKNIFFILQFKYNEGFL